MSAKIPLPLKIALPVAPVSLRPIAGPALPLAHFALAILALPAAFALAALKAPVMVRFFYLPENLAATHLITLGVLTAVAIGALQALLPLGPSARWRKATGWTGFALYAAGLAFFAERLLAGDLERIWPAVALVFAGILVELSALLPAMFDLRHFDASTFGIILAQVNLLIAGAFGTLYAFDKKWPFLPFEFFGRLYAHIHLAVAGFLLTLFVAVAHQLIPMFLWSDNPRHRWPWFSVGAVGFGSQALFLSLLLGKPWWPAGLAIVAGFVFFILDGHGFVKTRRRPFPAVLRQTMAGEFALLAAAAVAVALWRGGAPQTDPSFRIRFAYGLLLVAGALPALVMGVLGRLAPEIVWHAALRPAPGQLVRVKPEGLLRGRPYLASGLVLLAGVAALAVTAGLGRADGFRIAAGVATSGALGQALCLADLYGWLFPGPRARRLARLPAPDAAALAGDKDEARRAGRAA